MGHPPACLVCLTLNLAAGMKRRREVYWGGGGANKQKEQREAWILSEVGALEPLKGD